MHASCLKFQTDNSRQRTIDPNHAWSPAKVAHWIKPASDMHECDLTCYTQSLPQNHMLSQNWRNLVSCKNGTMYSIYGRSWNEALSWFKKEMKKENLWGQKENTQNEINISDIHVY